MISLILSFAVLIAGYLIYGRVVERVFAPDDRTTPAYTKQDGVDYIPMPTWKVFLVQLLNIAGTGPIFGALMGACFGPAVFLLEQSDARHDIALGRYSLSCKERQEEVHEPFDSDSCGIHDSSQPYLHTDGQGGISAERVDRISRGDSCGGRTFCGVRICFDKA